MNLQVTPKSSSSAGITSAFAPLHFATAVAAVASALFLALAPAAGAAKQPVDFFGGTGSAGGEFEGSAGVAVNDSGAGPADPGDVYVLDPGRGWEDGHNRVERFGRDDHGTPGDTGDDSYYFISAWGAGVETGGTDYEICTVAERCRAATASGGNGTPAGNGALNKAGAVAVDQDTGEVYVADRNNFRVNVYEGDGTFLRSFGWDVVESGPGNVPGADEQQRLTVKAGGGKFSLDFEGATTGARGFGRVSTGGKVISGVRLDSGAFVVGQVISSVFRGIPAGTTITKVDPAAKTITMSQAGLEDTFTDLVADDLPHDASAAEVEAALDALPTIGGVGGSVSVSGGPGDEGGTSPYEITFGGALSGRGVEKIVPHSGLQSGSGTPSATVTSVVPGGAYEVCVAAEGDVCRRGADGNGAGEIGLGRVELFGDARNIAGMAEAIAVSPPDGDPATGAVFVADTGNRRINSYDFDGSDPSSFATDNFRANSESPRMIAVDSRGIVYAVGSDAAATPLIERYDSENANGGGVGFLAPIKPDGFLWSLAVDPDSDQAGPDTDILYVGSNDVQGNGIRQFGPLNQPGLTAPPLAADDTHGSELPRSMTSLAVEPSTGRLFVTGFDNALGGSGVFVLDNASPTPPTASLDSLSAITSHSVLATGTVDPNGPPATSYHFEYSTDGSNWSSTPTVVLGSQEDPQAVQAMIDPPPSGLAPNTLYHVRLVAGRKFGAPAISAELTFTTQAEAPLVETTGTPQRTATTARLLGRVTPNGSPTTYRFEYGTQGPCEANPCTSTPARPAGGGAGTELVAESIEGLEPATTYHYRLVGESAAPGSPAYGAERTVTTRPSDAALSHGHFPGPSGSDRAWELVSIPDASGNPVGFSQAFSDDGTRAVYGIFGGTPIADSGSLLSLYFSERSPQGWQTKLVTPPREEIVGAKWYGIYGAGDLSSLSARNFGEDTGTEQHVIWRLRPGGQPEKLFQPLAPQRLASPEGTGNAGYFGVSADGSRTIAFLTGGTLDPAFPAASAQDNLYDVSSGAPQLVSLLPGGAAPACGVTLPANQKMIGAFGQNGTQVSHWVSADGSRVVFPSQGEDCDSGSQLYLRDIPSGETRRVSPPPVSGQACEAGLVNATPGAVFFWTQARLTAADTEPTGCAVSGVDKTPQGDVYRFDLDDGALKCVTCVAAVDADVYGGGPTEIAVSDDGSRVYFSTQTRLLAGAPPSGTPAIYRADVGAGTLAYVAPGDRVGPTQPTVALTGDGTLLFFGSSSSELNPLGGGAGNGGTYQYYRYDDRDRSLVCVSCPEDGLTPQSGLGSFVGQSEAGQPNVRALAEDGTFAFVTTSPLSSADQNTPGPGADIREGSDVYEWRDGRQLLVTDGLTSWNPEMPPIVEGISPSGRDLFFGASAQYTPDALDANRRLYDARIGGGISFPPPPKPCPLEVCQGTPRGAPEELAPGSGSFSGPGNARPKAKTKKKAKHRKHRHRAKHHRKGKAGNDRRAHR